MQQLLRCIVACCHPYRELACSIGSYHEYLHVQGIQTCFSHHGERVVFFEEELTGGIESDSMVRQAALNVPGSLHDQCHSFIPGRSFQLTVSPDLGILQSIWMVQCFPTALHLSIDH